MHHYMPNNKVSHEDFVDFKVKSRKLKRLDLSNLTINTFVVLMNGDDVTKKSRVQLG